MNIEIIKEYVKNVISLVNNVQVQQQKNVDLVEQKCI